MAVAADDVDQSLCHLLEQGIASGVAKCVIYIFEPVEVEQEQGRWARRACLPQQCLTQEIADFGAIDQSCQCIESCQPRDFGFGPPDFGKIGAGTDEAAQLVEPVIDGAP